MSNDIMDQMRASFRAEALDLLIELDTAMLSLEENPGDAGLVNRVFRAIHTIKGTGGTAGFRHLAQFVHKLEEAFDLAREGKLTVTPELIDCALQACDVIRAMIEDKDASNLPGEVAVKQALEKLLPASQKNGETAKAKAKQAAEPRLTAFNIVFKPELALFYSGTDPITILDDLRLLGQAHITAHTDQVPLFAGLDVESCYLWWEVLLVTDRDQGSIEKVFEFVEGQCELSVRPMEDQAGAVALLGSVPQETLELFKVECGDHLVQLEEDAQHLAKSPDSRQHLDSAFRCVHSIKGNAGLLIGQLEQGSLSQGHPLQLILRMAHALESLLDPFREAGAEPVAQEIVQTILKTGDGIYSLLGSLLRRPDANDIASLLDGLESKAETQKTESDDASLAAFLNTTSQCLEMMAGCLKQLQEGSTPVKPAVSSYVRGLKTLTAAAQYRKCDPLEKSLAEQMKILDASMRTGAALGDLEQAALGTSFQEAVRIVDGIASGGSSISPAAKTDSTTPATREAKQGGAATASSTIRIEQAKLDRLMRSVGELLVARGAFPLLVHKLNNGGPESAPLVAKDLKEAGASVSRIADELQASLMSIRMLPVKTLFQRFPRLVRDLARSLGKEVHLVMEGESIELDKTILEQISDPLVHVIRNSVDHGLETPEVRRASGKDETGQLTLRASHDAGRVVIEVADDGKGLDAEALKRKALEKGLITHDAAAGMSDEAAFQLIFMPGLSTAAKVTDVSGRGVGMDVVRSNVRNLQGTIDIKSKRGQGTSLIVRLPTSLMISKGILMECGGSEYILPLGNILDMVKMPPEEVHEYRSQRLAQIRGNLYPVFALADVLGLQAKKTPLLSIAIVEVGGLRYGLIVDRFVTEVEVLVKPLSGGLAECKEFQGAAIMGDGRVVLVLNAQECQGAAAAVA